MRTLRVLYVTNPMPLGGCGVASFGIQQASALRAAGADVTVCETWPPTYLPGNAGDYDVVHLNWHPLTLGHIQAQHLPVGPLLSAHLHEYVPQWEANPPDVFKYVQLKFSSEPIPWDPSVIFWQIPVPDVRPAFDDMWSMAPIWVGHTGLRGDGLDRLSAACAKNNWNLSVSCGWAPMQAEVDRLACCAVVVVQNHGGYSGQSSAVMTAIASRRPVVVNSGRMLEQIRRINEEEYNGSQLYVIEDAETAVKHVLIDLRLGGARRPLQLADDYSWRKRVPLLLNAWERELGGRG